MIYIYVRLPSSNAWRSSDDTRRDSARLIIHGRSAPAERTATQRAASRRVQQAPSTRPRHCWTPRGRPQRQQCPHAPRAEATAIPSAFRFVSKSARHPPHFPPTLGPTRVPRPSPATHHSSPPAPLQRAQPRRSTRARTKRASSRGAHRARPAPPSPVPARARDGAWCGTRSDAPHARVPKYTALAVVETAPPGARGRESAILRGGPRGARGMSSTPAGATLPSATASYMSRVWRGCTWHVQYNMCAVRYRARYQIGTSIAGGASNGAHRQILQFGWLRSRLPDLRHSHTVPMYHMNAVLLSLVRHTLTLG